MERAVIGSGQQGSIVFDLLCPVDMALVIQC